MTAKAEPVPGEATEEAITGLSQPRNGKPDDLTQIYGIDSETEKKLNALGLYHIDQIACSRPGSVAGCFVSSGFSGRFPAGGGAGNTMPSSSWAARRNLRPSCLRVRLPSRSRRHQAARA